MQRLEMWQHNFIAFRMLIFFRVSLRDLQKTLGPVSPKANTFRHRLRLTKKTQRRVLYIRKKSEQKCAMRLSAIIE